MNNLEHIVLDIDRTLIDSDENQNVYPRPHLEIFLFYCFMCFKSVSIWTAGNIQWYEHVNERVFSKILDPNHEFKHVFTNEDCLYLEGDLYKPLNYMYKFDDNMNSSNTIIIDDNQLTCQKNPNSSYLIKPYFMGQEDNELLKLLELFQENFSKKIKEIEENF